MNYPVIKSGLVISLIAMASCAAPDSLAPRRSSSDSCGLSCLKRLALMGDVDAAEKVWRSSVNDSNTFWSGIAAQNGSPAGALGYAKMIALGGTRAECYRALYWAGRARSLGDKSAQTFIDRLNQEKNRSDFACGCDEAPPDAKSVGNTCRPKILDARKYLPVEI